MSQSQEAALSFDFFKVPKSEDLEIFFKFHPQQNTSKALVQKVFWSKDGTNRRWLSYSEESHDLYCFVCMAFAKPTDTSPFISGMVDWKHVHQRIEEHEKSKMHRDYAEAYFLRASKSNIEGLLMESQLSVHREQVRRRRQVLERIIDVIKVIGKRGLSYRGTKSEVVLLR